MNKRLMNLQNTKSIRYKTTFVVEWVENSVGIGENAGYHVLFVVVVKRTPGKHE